MLREKSFNETLVQSWIDEICSRVSKQLVETNKPFKYIVTACIMQKNGAGLHLCHAAHWDASFDNAVVVRWPTEKKKDPNAKLVCIVTVYGVAY